MAPHLLSGENFSFIRQQSNQSVNEYVYLTFVLVLLCVPPLSNGIWTSLAVIPAVRLLKILLFLYF